MALASTLYDRHSELRTRWRDRLIGSQRFRRWAAALPISRRLMRREGERLFDLMAGFVYSQIVCACVELGLLKALGERSATNAELAAHTGLPIERMNLLIDAAVSLGLLERRTDGACQLGRFGTEIASVPGLEALVRHHRIFYRDISDPVGLFRGETQSELPRFWPYVLGAAVTDPVASDYSALMAATQDLVAEEVLRSVNFAGVAHLMDVGGGTGAFLGAVARMYPRLQLSLFDLPAVVRAADHGLCRAGMSGRITIHGGDFTRDRLPEGADAISLVRVLYDHTDETVAELLSRVHAALPSGGRVIIAEPMSGGFRPSRFADAYFGLYTLAMGTGRVRTAERIGELLSDSGFASVRFPRTNRPFVTDVAVGRKLA